MTTRHLPWGGYEIIVASHARNECTVRVLSSDQEIIGTAIHNIKGFDVPATGRMPVDVDTFLAHVMLCSSTEYTSLCGRLTATPHHRQVMAALRRYIRMTDHNRCGIELWVRQEESLNERSAPLRALHGILCRSMRRRRDLWTSGVIQTNVPDVAIQLLESPTPTLNVYFGDPLSQYSRYVSLLPMTLVGTSYGETARQLMVLEEIGIDMSWYMSEIKTISRLLEV